MAVNWNAENCEATKVANEFPADSSERDDYYAMRFAMVWAVVAVGFPPKSEWAITEQNWEQMFIRLHMLELACGAYRQHVNEGVTEEFFTPEEVKSMIGLTINAGNTSDQKFNAFIIRQLKDKASDRLEGRQPE